MRTGSRFDDAATGTAGPGLLDLPDTELTDEQYRTISTFVHRATGINLHSGKRELIRARLGKRLRQLKLSGYSDYLEYVKSDETGNEIVAMLDALSTNVTRFFREAEHFEFLRSRFLPERIAAAGRYRRMRFWSAGCSSGEEPYSLAIELREALLDGASWDARILATDLSTRVLERAVEGTYDAERLADVPEARVRRHFERIENEDGAFFRVRPEVARLVTFARLNLMDAWPMKGPFDAIFCRNVMIYFDRDTQIRLVERFSNLLSPGGLFIIGHSESLVGSRHRFEYVLPTVYRKA